MVTDFEYIGLINDVPMTLIARQNFPAKDFKEFLTYIKANNAKLTLANAGVGAASHLCGLLFMSTIEVDMTTVPYKGTAPAMSDLLGGQVDIMCDQTTNTSAQIEGGKVRAYAVTTLKPLTTPALLMFSITTVCLSCLPHATPRLRPTVSVGPPAAKGMIMVIGLVG